MTTVTRRDIAHSKHKSRSPDYKSSIVRARSQLSLNFKGDVLYAEVIDILRNVFTLLIIHYPILLVQYSLLSHSNSL